MQDLAVHLFLHSLYIQWDSVGNEDVVKSDEFEKFEEERIRNIRESFAKGKIKKK